MRRTVVAVVLLGVLSVACDSSSLDQESGPGMRYDLSCESITIEFSEYPQGSQVIVWQGFAQALNETFDGDQVFSHDFSPGDVNWEVAILVVAPGGSSELQYDLRARESCPEAGDPEL